MICYKVQEVFEIINETVFKIILCEGGYFFIF